MCAKTIFAHSLDRINISGAFLEYAKRKKHVLKQIRTFNNACRLQREAVSRQNLIGDHILAREEQRTSLVIYIILPFAY
jgi:hypothetical protein